MGDKKTDYAIANTISGQEIKNLRKSLELTQAELARQLYVVENCTDSM